MPASLEGLSDSEQRRIIVEMISESVGLPLDSMLKEVKDVLSSLREMLGRGYRTG
jgi:hypothetical protein